MKLLLYCTKAKPYLVQGVAKPMHTLDATNPFNFNWKLVNKGFSNDRLNGKIVAECDFEVEEITNCGTSFMIMKYDDLQESYRYTNEIARGSCLDYTDLRRYLGTNNGYVIHIKNLHIFDKSKELSDYKGDSKGNFFKIIKKAPQNMQMVLNEKLEDCILISIRPEWLCKILNGEKTIEVRKKVLKEMS